MHDANPYQAPGSVAAVTSAPSNWRFVAVAASLFFAGVHFLFWVFSIISVVADLNPSMSPLAELIGGALMFGACGVGWLLTAWLWYRARYIWAAVASVLSSGTIAIMVVILALAMTRN